MQLYTLSDPRTGYVRYVGKTARGLTRRLCEHLQPNSLRSKTHKNHWLRQLVAEGLKPRIEELPRSPGVEIDEDECFWIEQLRALGCPLTNLAAGGEGLRKGSRMSEETRRRMSVAHVGKPSPKPPGWAENHAASIRGRAMSPEVRKSRKVIQTGRIISEETRQKMRASMAGKKRDKRPFVGPDGTVYKTKASAVKATGLSRYFVMSNFARC